jgi:multidrug efflux pump subunit AcrA (membrane-fusion protein)
VAIEHQASGSLLPGGPDSHPHPSPRTMTPKSPARRWIVILVVIAVVVAVAGAATRFAMRGNRDDGAGVKDEATPRENKPVPVTVTPAVARPVQRKVQVVGTMIGREEITVTGKVEGRIVRIHHDLGDEVKPGDVLLEIDDTDYKLAVAEAERMLDVELSRFGLSSLPPDNFDITSLPMVVRSAALERSTGFRFERAKRLKGTNAISDEEFTLAEAEYQVAKANYQQSLLDAKSTLAAIRQKKATLDTARQRLVDTKVQVPAISDQPVPVIGPDRKPSHLPPVTRFSVSRRMISEGEMLRISPTTSMSVYRLVVDDYLKLGATVPERYLDEVKIGQEVDIEVEAHRGRVFKGLVIRINPTVEPANRTFQILIGVPNPDRKLRAGSFAKAAIATRVDPAAITVPEESIVSFAGVTKIFVARDGKAREVQVTPGIRVDVSKGIRDAGWVEVTGNVKPGEAIVTTGQSQLSDGKPLRIREGK